MSNYNKDFFETIQALLLSLAVQYEIIYLNFTLIHLIQPNAMPGHSLRHIYQLWPHDHL